MDVGVIGVGSMGKNHARVYSEMKGVDSVGVYDVDTVAAKTLTKTIDCFPYPALEEMLRDVDAVSVCVPTQYHYKVASQVIDAGIDILIEKPLCSNYVEACALCDMIPPSIVSGVGHIERFNPVVSEISKIINQPLYIEMKRHNPSSSRNVSSSIVDDLMIHDIDILFNAFHAQPSEIHAVGNSNVCNATMTCFGVPVSLSASRVASKKFRTIYIEQADFTIEGDLMTQEITIYHKPEKHEMVAGAYVRESVIERVMVNKVEPLRAELQEFIRCANTRDVFPISVLQGASNILICEDIKECMGE